VPVKLKIIKKKEWKLSKRDNINIAKNFSKYNTTIKNYKIENKKISKE